MTENTPTFRKNDRFSLKNGVRASKITLCSKLGYYRGLKDGETIQIVVRYYANVNRELMEGRIKVGEEAISRYAKSYG